MDLYISYLNLRINVEILIFYLHWLNLELSMLCEISGY